MHVMKLKGLRSRLLWGRWHLRSDVYTPNRRKLYLWRLQHRIQELGLKLQIKETTSVQAFRRLT
jgi:hypothetical protein